MASSKPAVVRYTQEEFKELTIQCLWFCLAENAHKKKIKKDKIIEHCLAKDKKQLDIIMKSVDCLLNSKFGLKLEPAQEDGYFIMQNMQLDDDHRITTDEEDEKEKHILSLVIAAIHLNDGQMNENEMWDFLKLSGLLQTETNVTKVTSQSSQSQRSIGGKRGIKRTSSTFERNDMGNKYYEKLLKKTFVQELFLEYKRNSNISQKVAHNSKSGLNYIFILGPRAKSCIVEKKLKDYVSFFESLV